MKKFIHRIQDLSQKAGQWKDAVEGVPGQAARLRDTVLVTAGQLQELRRDVQTSVVGLRAANDDGIAAALNEIQAGADEIRKAGYELSGVEMELDPVQRLIVLLDKVADVRAAELQSLLGATAGRRTLHGLLSSLVKAEEFAARCGLQELDYRQLRVSVGPIPSIRLIWRAEEVEEVVVVPPALPTAPSKSPGTPALPPVSEASPFGKDSFFERRAPSPLIDRGPAMPVAGAGESQTLEAVESDISVNLAAPPKPESPGSRTSGDWRTSALDRFKRMPDLSKH